MEKTGTKNGNNPVADSEVKHCKNNTWKQVTLGGVTGVAIGTAATAAFGATMNSEEEVLPEGVTLNGVDGHAYIDGTVPVADVSGDMSFGEAFAAARLQVGPGGVFVWHGQVYSTYTAEEWNGMSAAEHAEFGSHLDIAYNEHEGASQHNGQAPEATVEHHETASQQGHHHPAPEHAAPDGQEVTVVAVADGLPNQPAEPVVTIDEPTQPQHEPVIEVLNYETVTTADGSLADVAVVNVNGQSVGLYDVNQDGIADLAAQDLNNDNQIAANEISDISDMGISMQPFHEEYLAQNSSDTSDTDYINDGNVESYMA